MRLLEFTALSSLLVLFLLLAVSAEQCGKQAGGARCPSGMCCSNFGWCGNTQDYCGPGKCQSQCPSGPGPTPRPPTPTPGPSTGDISNIISSSMFDQMLKHRNDNTCQGKSFYTYNAFITAARSFRGFGTTGDTTRRKREVAAFFAQTSHETTGGWDTAPDGRYAWGYCYLREQGNPPSYCVQSSQWPCAPGQKYYGRGPIQISYNYNYGPCGRAIGQNLLNNPDLVATNAVVSFKSAIWFWMTAQSPKPSCHDVITGRWTPSAADRAANRLPGYGVITNIINGGLECGHGSDARVQDRIGFYRRYCSILGVSPGDNIDCGNQKSFNSGLLLETM
ncbi:endochitinase 3 precursor [Nicotiana tabacum]|uniref:Endochitinase 3 n=2 Tax=Nicotiana tabacum TaxID=4097 RepID=CHI3_TOBAC|nr:endochitinase 3 precursor [Nicotiana tabacum]P29059.1 RecName: Full=Endochitinase 3; Flags: Precursor [Nicotiana tabacum]CAA45821.1 chitinase C class I [Nicotiana tabacum]